jgi:G:T/U-mismatch repair DNA glycosylase
VKSREQNFFYGHPQNRFWKVIAALFGQPVPATIPAKKELILSHGLALCRRTLKILLVVRNVEWVFG